MIKCPLCGKEFKNQRACDVHMALKKHIEGTEPGG